MNLIQHTFDGYTPFRCFKPRQVFSGGELRSVGCYHCPACEASRMDEYARMIQIEASQHKYTYFLTLTFRQSELPIAEIIGNEVVSSSSGEVLYPNRFDSKRFVDSEVIESAHQVSEYSHLPHGQNTIAVFDRSILQKFIKRLRKYVSDNFFDDGGEAAKVRVFAIGELGPKSLRPHFHLLVYSNSTSLFRSKSLIFDSKNPGRHLRSKLPALWSLGRCDGELSKGKCAQYLSSYTTSSADLPKILQTRAFRPFVVHSQNFGFPKNFDLCGIYNSEPLFDKRQRACGTEALGLRIDGIGPQSSSVFFRFPDSFFRTLFPKLPYSHDMEYKEVHWLAELWNYTQIYQEFARCCQRKISSILSDRLKLSDAAHFLYNVYFGYDTAFPFFNDVNYQFFASRFRSYSVHFPVWDSQEESEFFFVRLLTISRHYIEYASQVGVSVRDYVDRSLRMYKANDEIKLHNFYAAQEVYFESHPLTDLKYFYDLQFTDEELLTNVISNPAKVNFLRSAGVGIFDTDKNVLKMLNFEHNSKIYENNYVQLYCVSDTQFVNWKEDIVKARKEHMKHKIQNEIMFNYFTYEDE